MLRAEDTSGTRSETCSQDPRVVREESGIYAASLAYFQVFPEKCSDCGIPEPYTILLKP